MTSPRSGDGPERSEGFAAGGREQSRRARAVRLLLPMIMPLRSSASCTSSSN